MFSAVSVDQFLNIVARMLDACNLIDKNNMLGFQAQASNTLVRIPLREPNWKFNQAKLKHV